MAWMRPSEALTKLPRLFFQGTISFSFDGMPLSAERISLRKKMNLMKVGLDSVLRTNMAQGLPPIIQVEPTNVCNLRCHLCPSGLELMKRKKGFLSFELFQRILDELGDVLVLVYLYGWGEPFLNNNLTRFIEACTVNNILTLTSTNGHFLQTVEEAMRVVDAGLTALVIALDGSTQEIYESYRKGGNVEKVKQCIANIEEAKARRGSPLPYTNLRVVVNRENQEDLSNLELFAKNAGVNMFSYKSLGSLVPSDNYKDFEPGNSELRRFDHKSSTFRKGPLIQCPYPYRQPTIFWDGTVVGCEFDYDLQRPWGNIDLKGFSKLWNGPPALQLRHAIRKGFNRPSFCVSCPYQGRVRNSCVLSYKDIKPLDRKEINLS